MHLSTMCLRKFVEHEMCKYQVQKYIWYSRNRDSLGALCVARIIAPPTWPAHWNRTVPRVKIVLNTVKAFFLMYLSDNVYFFTEILNRNNIIKKLTLLILRTPHMSFGKNFKLIFLKISFRLNLYNLTNRFKFILWSLMLSDIMLIWCSIFCLKKINWKYLYQS